MKCEQAFQAGGALNYKNLTFGFQHPEGSSIDDGGSAVRIHVLCDLANPATNMQDLGCCVMLDVECPSAITGLNPAFETG